jgi:hypothetical protein
MYATALQLHHGKRKSLWEPFQNVLIQRLNLEVPKVHKSIVPQDQVFFSVGQWLYIPNLTGIINQLQKKKKVFQSNEREQAPTALSCLLEGNFFNNRILQA